MKKRYNKELSINELAAIPDEAIDYSDISQLDDRFWSEAKIVFPEENKKQLTLRLDADIVEWFKSQGNGYQTRMNAVLRSFYESQAHK
ncbi:MAG: BrnA antitoxin family protein [Alphaproteobacteria bacterium]|nr:BrnA antitoxin family protein [Alphaproteobacteria bacterium]